MTEAAEGLQYFALAGWSADEMGAALEPTLKLAGAAGMQLGTTCDIVTDTMSMFGMKADEAAKMTDILAYAQANSNTSVQQLGEALKYCGAGANAMGYDLADTAGILGKFADQGLKGSSAGTTLNSVLRDMKAKAKDGAIAIGDTSVAIVDAQGNYRDFNDILHDVEQATNGMSAAQRDQALSSIWGTEALKGVNMALNVGSDSIKKFEEGIRSSDGAASQMYDTMQNNLKGSIDNLKSAFEGVCITIGNLLLPIMQSLVDKLTNALTWFNNLNPGIQKVIVSVGGFIAVLGPLLLIIGQVIIFVGKVGTALSTVVGFFSAGGAAASAFGAVMAFLSGPIGIVIAAIAALIAVGVLLYKNWDTIKEYGTRIWGYLREFISSINEKIKEKISTIWQSIKNTFSNILNAIKTVVSNVFNAIKNTISNILNNVKSVVSKIFNAIKSTISNILNSIKSTVSKIFNAIKSTISSILNAVKSTVSSIFNAIKSTISSILNAVKSVVSSVFNSIKSTISSILNAVKSVVSSVFNSIKSVISSSLNGAKAVVSTVFNGMKTVISNCSNAIKTVVKTVFGSLKEIMTAPFKAAEKVISGILGGISKAIGKVTEGIKKVTSLGKGKMIERPGFDEEEFYNDNDYSMARFNYAKAQQTYQSGIIAESYSMLDTIKGFKNDLKSSKDNSKVSTSNNFNINLNIDKMMNTDNRSIEDIADELAFYIKRKSFI